MKNLLFITADQWRGECLSALDHLVQTPNLDALAEQGRLFKCHYANAVPCGPSRASLHTGMYLQNHRSGTNGTPLDARHTNWAIESRQAGYDPVLFGYTDTANDPRFFDPDDAILKSYEGPLPGINPVVQMGTYPDAWADWLEAKGQTIPDPNFRLYTDKTSASEYENGGNCPAPMKVTAEHHDTYFMVDQVIDYLKQQDKPWCVHLSLLRPHPPWIAPEPFNQLYDPDQLKEFVRQANPQKEAQQHPFLDYFLNRKHSAAPSNTNKLARLKSSYYGLMSEVDSNLGRLFTELKSSGDWDNTLIVFTSDHGEQLGDHWLLGKMGYFDQSYYIPLIIRDPDSRADITRNSHCQEFTENIDIMPTMLEWLGLEIPSQCDGRSLLPLLHHKEKQPDWRKQAHWEFDFRDVSGGEALEQHLGLNLHQCSLNVIRDKYYKYVHFTNLPPLFFDLQQDPEEFTNLAQDPDYAHLVLEYSQKMLSWRMLHDEQTLTHMKLTEQGVISRPAMRYPTK